MDGVSWQGYFVIIPYLQSFFVMYNFLVQNSLYVVLLVALTVWIGIAYYLFRLERSVTKLQKSSGAAHVGNRSRE